MTLLMKITFRSSRQRDSDQLHEPEFTPLVFSKGGLERGRPGQPAEWGPGGRVLGEIGTISLGKGIYVVNLEFEAAELKNWIQRYIEDDPREAMRLLAEMQAEATISLAQKAKRDVLDEIKRS